MDFAFNRPHGHAVIGKLQRGIFRAGTIPLGCAISGMGSGSTQGLNLSGSRVRGGETAIC